MPVTVGAITYDDFDACLQAATRMVQTGLPKFGTLTEQHEVIRLHISALKILLAREQKVVADSKILRLITLEAEFQHQNGHPQQAIALLTPEWNKWGDALMEWTPNSRLSKHVEHRLLRQRLWTALHYVFYRYYYDALYSEALKRLLLLEQIIQVELPTDKYFPHGSLAICNYFTGVCYREADSLGAAERSFLNALTRTNSRLALRLADSGRVPAERNYELLYKDVLSGRIMSGLGLVALNQGRLLQAEVFLAAAQNFLSNSSQESLKLFIATLRNIAIRRRVGISETAYAEAMKAVEASYYAYGKIDDLVQRRRCAAEMIRGYLDLYEFIGDHEGRTLRSALEWLDRLEENVRGENDQAKFLLYKARYSLLANSLDEAEDALNACRRIKGRRSRPALPALEAMVYLRQNDLENAIDTLQKHHSAIRKTIGKAVDYEAHRHQALVQAECYVLMAQVYIARKEKHAARHYLKEWEMLSPFVDNYYLHRVAASVRDATTMETPFETPYDFPIYHPDTQLVIRTVDERVDDYRKFLMNSVAGRKPRITQKELGDIIGKSRFTAGRRVKRSNGDGKKS